MKNFRLNNESLRSVLKTRMNSTTKTSMKTKGGWSKFKLGLLITTTISGGAIYNDWALNQQARSKKIRQNSNEESQYEDTQIAGLDGLKFLKNFDEDDHDTSLVGRNKTKFKLRKADPYFRISAGKKKKIHQKK